MPRMTMTDRSIKALQGRPGFSVDYFDARLPRFAMRITEKGNKSWIILYRHGGRLRRMTLGPYPAVSLADARELAKAAFHLVAAGRDPATEKHTNREAPTFAELAQEYMERHAKVRKRERCWREDQRLINREFLPRWRHWKAQDVKRRDIQELLDETVARGAPIQANNNFALIRKMFNFAVQREIVAISPCMGMGRPTRPRQRDRVLTYDEIRALWLALDACPPIVADVIRLELLTAQRGGEVLTMRWEDLDLTSEWWTIPAMYAKNGRSHRVPLGPQVLAILTGRRRANTDSPWVFPSTRRTSRPLTTVVNDVRTLRTALGFFFNPHDLRRTAASHMTGMGIPRLTVAKLLNHVETGVTAIYDRYSYDAEKRRALVAWGNEIERISRQVQALSLPEQSASSLGSGITAGVIDDEQPAMAHPRSIGTAHFGAQP
jgi:integrase